MQGCVLVELSNTQPLNEAAVQEHSQCYALHRDPIHSMAARRAALVACSLCAAAALVPPTTKPQRHLRCRAAPAERSIDASHPMFRKLLDGARARDE